MVELFANYALPVLAVAFIGGYCTAVWYVARH